MGDLIQMLPALSDAAHSIPGIGFDWVVEESFVEIAQLHPSVKRIISLPYRRWKKNLRQSLFSGEIPAFLRQLRDKKYDMVIDAQSNLKSATVSMLTRGTRYGLDKTSVREYGAHWACQKQITISRDQNHALRMRKLMAAFLDYELPDTDADYGIRLESLPKVDLELPDNYVFITAICSNKDRLWPESNWQIVIDDLLASGYEVVLPWWSQVEKERMQRLKNGNTRVHMIPPMNLLEKASVLAKASAAISLDTGLAHMAAALNVPNITLYGQTSANSTGAYGKNQIHLSATGPACSPCLRMTCNYKGPKEQGMAPCLQTITPEQVLSAFYSRVCLQLPYE